MKSIKPKLSHNVRGLSNKNYSDFWMDSDNSFSGMPSNHRSDLVKTIKLNNYRRAITNFVRIVTGKDIPVTFHGSDSYTDGENITISTDVGDSNFDVTVGLSLHEASHIVYSDFSYLKSIKNDIISDVFSLLNWIEDRRIDNIVFSTSPGYKAYYHKMYNHYWNNADIEKALAHPHFRTLTVDNYLMHIFNMMSPLFSANALPGLDEIVDTLDIKNISRLKNTLDASDLAHKVYDMISALIRNNADKKREDFQLPKEQENQGSISEEANSNNMTDSQIDIVKKLVEQQRAFTLGAVDKKTTSKKILKALSQSQDQDMEIQAVGTSACTKGFQHIYLDMTSGHLLDDYHNCIALNLKKEDSSLFQYLEINKLNPIIVQSFRGRGGFLSLYEERAEEGINMGALLGRKLQIHNETRERVDNRLTHGKIDNRRLAHIGYGLENVFSQISIDKYKKANLHISLDGSGSMKGDCWANSIKMTLAIAKALSYTQGIELQVSIRTSYEDSPVTILVYNSIKNNNIPLLKDMLTRYAVNGATPEGLCFEALIRQDKFIKGTTELNSYFLNISDGLPGFNTYTLNTRNSKTGEDAVIHTKNQINTMRNRLNMRILSFYISDYTDNDINRLQANFLRTYSGRLFREMYGKAAQVVDANSALSIAVEFNKRFLSKD